MIQTPRTRIRPYGESDMALIAPILSDTTTMSFWPRPLNEKAVAEWVERNAGSFRETGLGRMLVELRVTGEVIGDCGVALTEVDGKVEHDLGYIIHNSYWERGLGVECARACLEYALREKGLRRIVANMPHDHPASIRVAERLGMDWERSFANHRNRDILTRLYVYTP